ncbi:hypothetical protein H4217_002416 [Coemansia sp. RSA 1939]|nr:hypothetical protein H4217_002416 [Coemansia sp. RSA 1939]
MFYNARALAARSAIVDWLGRKNMYPCAYRKLPMVFNHADGRYYVVWETTCVLSAPLFEWWTDKRNGTYASSRTIEPCYHKIDSNHHRYTVVFGPAVDSTHVHYRVSGYRFPTNQYMIKRPHQEQTLQALVISDNQNGPTNFRTVLSAVKKLYDKQGGTPDSIIHVGDAVQSAAKLSDWQTQFFSPMEDVGGYHHSCPLVFVPGNHDHDKRHGPNNNNYYMDMYHGIYDTGGLGSKKVVDGDYHRFYHSVSLGGARVIILDAECPSKEQSKFLARELQSESFRNARFRIVAVHIPPYVEFWDPYTWEHKNEKHWGEHVRLEYDPLFREYGVDLVISGHQHNYQRSTIRRSTSSEDDGSITYAIVGGAGGTIDYKRVEDWKMYNVTFTDFHFVSLEIDDRELRWSAYDVFGTTVDQFKLQR